MVRVWLALFCSLIAVDAIARPLVRSSEDTAATLCAAAEVPPEDLKLLCEEALAFDTYTKSERASLLISLGDALFDLSEYDTAEARYREAISLDPLASRPLASLGWYLHYLERYDEAVDVFARALEIDVNADILGGYGSVLSRSGQATLPEAFEYLNAALAIEPYSPWTLREKGWLLRDNGAPGAAEIPFRQALDLDGDDWNANLGLALAKWDQGALEDTLPYLGRAIELQPGDAWMHSFRAEILRGLERPAQAIPDAEAAIAFDPTYSAGYVEKALSLNMLTRRKEAFAVLEDGAQAGAASAYLYYYHAELLSDDGDYTGAMEIILRSIEMPDADEWDHNLLAYLANELDDPDRALVAADAAVTFNSEFPYAHYHAAVALLRQGHLEEGIARFDTAMAVGLPHDMVGDYVAELITEGKPIAAFRLRRRY